MGDLLARQPGVEGVLGRRRVQRGVGVVVEREAARAVEIHPVPEAAVRLVTQAAEAVEFLVGPVEELHHLEFVFPGDRPLEFLAVLVGEGLALVGIVEIILADELRADVAVRGHGVGLALILHEALEVAHHLEVEARVFHVAVEGLDHSRGHEGGNHHGLDVKDVERARARDGLGHGPLGNLQVGNVADLVHGDAGGFVELAIEVGVVAPVQAPHHSVQLGAAQLLRRFDDGVLLGPGIGFTGAAENGGTRHGGGQTGLEEASSFDLFLAHLGVPPSLGCGPRERKEIRLVRPSRDGTPAGGWM